jgi:hypothetical protein
MKAVAPLSLLSEASFDSFDSLYASAQAYAKLAGYAFVTEKSERRKGRILKFLHCKRGRKQQPSISNEDHCLRYRRITRNNCLVFIKARKRPDGLWDLCHRALEQECLHNYTTGEALAFPEHRRLNSQQATVVATHYTSGIAPSRTVAILRR